MRRDAPADAPLEMMDFGRGFVGGIPEVLVFKTRRGGSVTLLLVELILSCAEQFVNVLSLFTACCFITFEEKDPLICSQPSLCRLML